MFVFVLIQYIFVFIVLLFLFSIIYCQKFDSVLIIVVVEWIITLNYNSITDGVYMLLEKVV